MMHIQFVVSAAFQQINKTRKKFIQIDIIFNVLEYLFKLRVSCLNSGFHKYKSYRNSVLARSPYFGHLGPNFEEVLQTISTQNVLRRR